jgi:hypothetical protein
MPYINRNESGKVNGSFACQQYEGQEFIEVLPQEEPSLLELKIQALEKEWQKLPKGKQAFFQNNYIEVKQALLANNKELALEYITDIADFMITPDMQDSYQTLLGKVQEF